MAGIYVHIPFCKQKCRYCDFASFPDKIGLAESYMTCVYREMAMRATELKDYSFETMYIGGGTPSVIDESYIAMLVAAAKKYYNLDKNAEITIEMNPGTVSASKIDLYKKVGINRFSVGLQTANDKLLADLGRIHTLNQFITCAKLLRGCNYSVDIMIGLKGQSLGDISQSIEVAALYGAGHISMYALTPEDGTPIYTDYLNGELPDGDEVAELYEYGRSLLAEKGYMRYEVSNFCKKGFESRHNLNYWKRGEYVGLGVSASSFFSGRRLLNTLDLDEYMKCILSGFYPVIDSEEVSEKDARFEFVMLGLRTVYGVSAAEYKKAFGTEWKEDFSRAYQKTKEYLSEEGDVTRIRDEYLYVQNAILSEYAE